MNYEGRGCHQLRPSSIRLVHSSKHHRITTFASLPVLRFRHGGHRKRNTSRTCVAPCTSTAPGVPEVAGNRFSYQSIQPPFRRPIRTPCNSQRIWSPKRPRTTSRNRYGGRSAPIARGIGGRLSTLYYQLLSASFVLPASYCRLCTASFYCRLLTGNFPLRILTGDFCWPTFSGQLSRANHAAS